MTALASPVANAGDVTLTLGDWVLWLKRQRRLLPLLREAALERLLLHRAREAGLAVPDADLQAAADHFRRRHGLSSATQTFTWLEREGLSLDDLEAALERDLLVDRLRDHVTPRPRRRAPRRPPRALRPPPPAADPRRP
jgi:hypothetical protein